MTAVEPVTDRRVRAEANFARLAAAKDELVHRGIPDVLAEIHAERQWEDLGFGSFDEACRELLGGWKLALPSDERREVVAVLTGRGMSTRAIGSVLGVNRKTVERDQGGTNVPPVIGLDGKTYTRITPEAKRRADQLAEPVDLETQRRIEAERDEAERIAFIRDWWKRTESALLHLSTGCRANEYSNEYGPIYPPNEPFTVPELIDDVLAGLTDLRKVTQ